MMWNFSSETNSSVGANNMFKGMLKRLQFVCARDKYIWALWWIECGCQKQHSTLPVSSSYTLLVLFTFTFDAAYISAMKDTSTVASLMLIQHLHAS